MVEAHYPRGCARAPAGGSRAHAAHLLPAAVAHSVVATAANVADSAVLEDLLHGQETRVYGDQAYKGQAERIRPGQI